MCYGVGGGSEDRKWFLVLVERRWRVEERRAGEEKQGSVAVVDGQGGWGSRGWGVKGTGSF